MLYPSFQKIDMELVTQGDTSGTPSRVRLTLQDVDDFGETEDAQRHFAIRAIVADLATYTDASNATMALVSGTGTQVTAHSSGKDYTWRTNAGAKANGTLTFTGVVTDAEAATIGTRVYEFDVGSSLGAATVTIAAPGVVTRTAHGLSAGDVVFFQTTGALPTGLAANTYYYVLATDLAANTFKLSATAAGTAITTTGTQSGVHTLFKRTITAGRVPVQIASYATASQGSLHLAAQPTVGDTMTIDGRTYAFVANGLGNYAGEIALGTTVDGTVTAIVAALNGTDGYNTIHPSVTAEAGTQVNATTTFTATGVLEDGDQITIGNKTYTFKTALSTGPTVDGEILIGATPAASILNLSRAVMFTGTPGTDYSDKITAAHTQVSAGTPSQVNASATLTIDAGGANIKDGDTVEIGNKTYTFKTALTPTEGQVLIGANDAAALDNLKSAVNHTGTPDTDYKCAAAHTQVTATTNTDLTQVFSASIAVGAAGNVLASVATITDAKGAFGAATFAGGSDAVVLTASKTGSTGAVGNLLASTEGAAGAACANAAFTGTLFAGGLDKAVVTARVKGVNGDAIALSETFTASLSIWDDVSGGATLGTTTAGVSCSAANAITALAAAIVADASATFTAVDSTGDTLVVTADSVGTSGNLATTTTCANATWGGATMTGGTNACYYIEVDITDTTAETFRLLLQPAACPLAVPVDCSNHVLEITHAA